jgi:hypothetical protein
MSTRIVRAVDLAAGTIVIIDDHEHILETHATEHAHDIWTVSRVWLDLAPTNGYDPHRIIDVEPSDQITIRTT